MCDNQLVAVRIPSLLNHTEQTRLMFLWIPANGFSEKDRQNVNLYDINSDLSMNNNVFQGTN